MTYADCLSRVLVGTFDGSVPIGVDTSSEGNNRGRLITKCYQYEWLHLVLSTHLDPRGFSVSVPVPAPGSLFDCLITQSKSNRWNCSK